MLIRGFIFDFNGVLVNDEPLHCYGFQQALKEKNLTLSLDEYFEKYLPYDDYNFFLHFLGERGQPVDPEEIRRLVDLKSHHYFSFIQKNIPVIPESLDFIRALPAEVPVAIASGAARKEIEFMLAELESRDYFTTIIAAEDVVNGKPHPEAFLKALGRLQSFDSKLTCRNVVVFEDSHRGVVAAHKAGMKCVALTTAYGKDQLGEADLVVASLEGWTLSRLEEALAPPTPHLKFGGES